MNKRRPLRLSIGGVISQIEIYKSPIRLKEPFVTSLGPLTSAENVVVVIRTDKGVSGFGECSPFLTINGESMDTCFIVGQYFAKVLIGRNPLDIGEHSKLMDQFIYSNSSIKSAFDIALYDIASQLSEMPLYKFLNGNKDKTLVTDYTVSIGDATKMADDALKIKSNGFQIVKVKLGESKEKDLQRVRLIREAIGNDLSIRIDANQGWSVDTALQTLKALEKYNIEYCEEPIARWNFMELGNVSKQSKIPIMADESCCDHHDAKRLIDLNACQLFNIKLGKSSGIYKAQKIIHLAEQANIKMQVGGFLESRLGFTAAAHLALASSQIVYCDFDTPLMFAADPVVGGITYSANGEINVPETYGLGATMDEKYLQKLERVILH